MRRPTRTDAVLAACSFVTAIAALTSWWTNDNVEAQANCTSKAFTARDEANAEARKANLRWLHGFRNYLVHIEQQTSVDPLVARLDRYIAKTENAGQTANSNEISECEN